MAVESAIHNAKALAAKYRVFKRPRRGETRFQAGTRRILEHTWLRFKMEMRRAAKEIPLLPSQCGQEVSKFVRLKSVSEGDDIFGLHDLRDERATTLIQQCAFEILNQPIDCLLSPHDVFEQPMQYESSSHDLPPQNDAIVELIPHETLSLWNAVGEPMPPDELEPQNAIGESLPHSLPPQNTIVELMPYELPSQNAIGVSKLTIVQLKAELRRRGLPQSGTKSELIHRLL